MKTKGKLILNLMGVLGCTFLGSTPANAAWWKTALVCDDGAARVEVDLGERRNVQLVITDKNITDYLYRSGITAFGPYGQTGDVVSASLKDGIFDSSQFRGFTRQGFTPSCHSGFAATVKVYRDGNGLRLTGYAEPAGTCCWEMDSAGNCTQESGGSPGRELGNWYFENCEEQNL